MAATNAMDVGKQLCDLCSKGKFMDAINAVYAPNIVSVEAMEMPGHPRRQEGIAAIREKTKSFEQTHDIHSVKVTGPFPNGDRFACTMTLDVTAKEGPMKGKRMTMDEVCLYTVKDGKIVHEEFFYHMG